MKKILVGIIIGSDSDLPIMSEAAKILDDFAIPYELTIVSAHRTPDLMYQYAETAAKRGLKVIIAGAGGAAAVPGMVAAITPIPVIGVPIQSKTLSGLDSLYSIVQMPPGIPVATVAINGAKNAGLLAAKIIALNNKEIASKMSDYKNRLKAEVLHKAKKLEKIKYQQYLNENTKNS